MWLLKLHLAVSILCLLTHVGFRTVCKDLLVDNGYMKKDSKLKWKNFWMYFIPILNVALVLVLFISITMTKKELDEWIESVKKKKESKNNGDGEKS